MRTAVATVLAVVFSLSLSALLFWLSFGSWSRGYVNVGKFHPKQYTQLESPFVFYFVCLLTVVFAAGLLWFAIALLTSRKVREHAMPLLEPTLVGGARPSLRWILGTIVLTFGALWLLAD